MKLLAIPNANDRSVFDLVEERNGLLKHTVWAAIPIEMFSGHDKRLCLKLQDGDTVELEITEAL